MLPIVHTKMVSACIGGRKHWSLAKECPPPLCFSFQCRIKFIWFSALQLREMSSSTWKLFQVHWNGGKLNVLSFILRQKWKTSLRAVEISAVIIECSIDCTATNKTLVRCNYCVLEAALSWFYTYMAARCKPLTQVLFHRWMWKYIEERLTLFCENVRCSGSWELFCKNTVNS